MTASVLQAYSDILERIEIAAQKAGRTASDITLIAVTKTFGAPDILPVLKAGHGNFGENRVQETAGKWPVLKDQYSDLELHLIGPLQTNKVAEAVSLFDVIHTVDRPRIAEAIAREMKKQNRRCKIFVQVNTGDEAQKAGVDLREADSFIRQCREVYGMTLTGLMCIPPVAEAPDRHFQLLAKIAERNGLASLSMGMSGDFETAIAYGATHIRVGSAIFGTR